LRRANKISLSVACLAIENAGPIFYVYDVCPEIKSCAMQRLPHSPNQIEISYALNHQNRGKAY